MKVKKLDSFKSYEKLNPNIYSGRMIPLWNILDVPFECKYVYAISTVAGTVKGPYCHTKRTGIMTLLSGRVAIIYKEDDKYLDIWLDKKFQQVTIPNNTEYCILGRGIPHSILINICDYPWKEGDNETYVPDFSDFNFNKIRGSNDSTL